MLENHHVDIPSTGDRNHVRQHLLEATKRELCRLLAQTVKLCMLLGRLEHRRRSLHNTTVTGIVSITPDEAKTKQHLNNAFNDLAKNANLRTRASFGLERVGIVAGVLLYRNDLAS